MAAGSPWSGRTFGNDERLPRLPLPGLEQGCEQFISWCAPLLTADELAGTERAVRAFSCAGSPGRTLHAELAGYDAAAGVSSWLDAFWADRYLGYRDPGSPGTSFFVLLPGQRTGSPRGRARPAPDEAGPQLDRAAGLAAAAADYKVRLDAGLVPPDIRRGRPLSMHQHRFLFSATRVPGPDRDTVRGPWAAGDSSPAPRHIVVLCRGNIFRLDVLAPGGQPYPPSRLVTALRTIRSAPPAPPGTSVGQLTTQARPDWAASRAALLARGPANARALDDVETALFCLCLEEAAPSGPAHACDHLLHGGSAGRWSGKSVSLVVFADGSAGISADRAGLDVATVLGLARALAELTAAEQAAPGQAGAGPAGPGEPAAAPVSFDLGRALRAGTRAAAADHAARQVETVSTVVSPAGFGATAARQLGVSPDAFVQLACQRARGLIGATRETVTTRAYCRGRTETMRVVSPEVMGFVAAMDDPLVDTVTRRLRFRAAAARHAERSRRCRAGQAPEQYLAELRRIWRERGAQLGLADEPELFGSPGWLIMREDYLSTICAPSASIRYLGFGPAASTST